MCIVRSKLQVIDVLTTLTLCSNDGTKKTCVFDWFYK